MANRTRKPRTVARRAARRMRFDAAGPKDSFGAGRLSLTVLPDGVILSLPARSLGGLVEG